MSKSIKIWLAIILLPIPLFLSMFLLGLIGLVGYWGYYMPLWFLGEPFFQYSSDTGWFSPTIYGSLITLVIYSIVYWVICLTFLKFKDSIKSKISN